MIFQLLQAYGRRQSSGLSLFEIILIIVVSILVVAFIRGLRGSLKEVLAHWHHMFDTVPFSSQEFYRAVEEIVKSKRVPSLTTSRIRYAEGGILAPTREYLRVSYKNFAYDICAAPFAKGYFVSWWLGELSNPLKSMLVNIPFIGRLFRKRKKTFFEMDVEIMFKEAVTSCVKEVIDKLSESKGLRKLADAEWQAYNRHY